jgi:hypothetical protein
MQAEWRHVDTGRALTPGAQESNDIDYVLEQAQDRGEQLTVQQWLDNVSPANEPTMKALRHLGYSVSNGYWRIAGAPHSEKLKRNQKMSKLHTQRKSLRHAAAREFSSSANGDARAFCVRRRQAAEL